MNKLFHFAAAIVLASSLPLAQAATADTNRDGKVSATESAKDAGHKAKDIAKNAGHKFTRGVRRITHPNESGHASATRSDTRSMGAAGNSAANDDGGRRSRMDAAYANWQRKQQR